MFEPLRKIGFTELPEAPFTEREEVWTVTEPIVPNSPRSSKA